jgi:hypothetical protein
VLDGTAAPEQLHGQVLDRLERMGVLDPTPEEAR